jgi:hypothetical protein
MMRELAQFMVDAYGTAVRRATALIGISLTDVLLPIASTLAKKSLNLNARER